MSQLSKEWWKIKLPWLDETRRSLVVDSETVLWVCYKSDSPRSSGWALMSPLHLCSVIQSKWICFFPDYTSVFSLSSTPAPLKKLQYWEFSLLLAPSKMWKYTYFNLRISDMIPLAATMLLCGVGNAVGWVVGKCLLESCLICYTLLSPSGKSASLCYFGKFSEMILKKKKEIQQKHFPS